MLCPRCQTPNPDDANFCAVCAQPLRPGAVPPPLSAGLPPNLPPPLGYGGFPTPPTPMGENAALRMILPVGRSGWAIAAGYLGLFSLVLVPAPLALGVSLVAVWDLRRHREKHGWGRAVFGLVTGGLGTIVLVLIFLARSTPASSG